MPDAAVCHNILHLQKMCKDGLSNELSLINNITSSSNVHFVRLIMKYSYDERNIELISEIAGFFLNSFKFL